ncbi:MAG TPA: DUF2946 family protein [Gammaproteobacteria bacterium]|nr:DUF2946 family protein [Gammaproteobacteria bacterium]
MWLALALLVLAVQTGLPAHEDSHPVGQTDSLCQYCALGGNLFGMPNAALPPVGAAAPVETPLPTLFSLDVTPFPRTLFGRAPPSIVNA